MANHVVVNICGEEYTFVAEESEAYMQQVGSYVGERMREILNSSKVGRIDAAVLTAVNIADELFKAQVADEQLRTQLKESIEKSGKATAEIARLSRKISQLQKQIELQRQIDETKGIRGDSQS